MTSSPACLLAASRSLASSATLLRVAASFDATAASSFHPDHQSHYHNHHQQQPACYQPAQALAQQPELPSASQRQPPQPCATPYSAASSPSPHRNAANPAPPGSSFQPLPPASLASVQAPSDPSNPGPSSGSDSDSAGPWGAGPFPSSLLPSPGDNPHSPQRQPCSFAASPLLHHRHRASLLTPHRTPPPAPAPASSGARRGLHTAAAATPPDSLDGLTLAAIAAGLWDEGRDGREGLTPAAIVAALDRHIVGQAAAKRAVAVALRNRWRRQRVQPAAFRDEIMPKNILMVGPTGCGKTEVARRLAKLADAPFVKVEATKYTELGYVGRDVEEIIKDLVEAALVLVRQRAKERLAEHSAARAEAVILRALVGQHAGEDTLANFRELYRRGDLDNTTVDIDAALLEGTPGGQGGPGAGFGSGGGGGGGRFDLGPGGMIFFDKLITRPPNQPFGGPQGGGGNGRGGKKSMKVSEARSRLEEAESEKLLSSEQMSREAVRAAEQDGIVFIDEIDKIVEPSSGRVVSGGVSSEGVQRDLLPIIEGSVVPTKHGSVNTEHVLFICSGAFHTAKPSDMLAELQGRLPIRVELKGLTAEDFYRILTEPDNNMIRQQQELLATEGVTLSFADGAVRAISRLAEQANRLLDNIGARRLHTILERVLADISFSAPERVAEARAEGRETYEYVVDEQLVHRKLDDLLKKQDLSRYVL